MEKLRLHMQVTETVPFQLEAKVKATQGLSACPTPNIEHPTVIQSSSREKIKQKGSYSTNGT